MKTSSRIAGDGPISGSASSIVAGTVCGYHLIKIVGYSRTNEVPNGQQLESCPFQVVGRTWRVRCYPNGRKSENINFISFYLKLDGTLAEAETVKAKVKWSLLDQDGRPVPTYTWTTNTCDFPVSKSWGIVEFIKRVELEESEYLKDDSFTVKVDITIMSEFQAKETPSIVVPPSHMHRLFGDLLSSKTGIDVEFRVGGEMFSVHRLVLAAWSPVFRAQFYGLMKEGTTTEAICIDDMEAEVFKALLSFMYTDALPEMKQEEEYAMTLNLLVAADMYDLERLKLLCEDKLCNHINTSSVATILALAEQHHFHELKAVCLEFLSSLVNLDEAMESEGFNVLSKSCPGVMKDLLRSQIVPSLLGKGKSRE